MSYDDVLIEIHRLVNRAINAHAPSDKFLDKHRGSVDLELDARRLAAFDGERLRVVAERLSQSGDIELLRLAKTAIYLPDPHLRNMLKLIDHENPAGGIRSHVADVRRPAENYADYDAIEYVFHKTNQQTVFIRFTVGRETNRVIECTVYQVFRNDEYGDIVGTVYTPNALTRITQILKGIAN